MFVSKARYDLLEHNFGEAKKMAHAHEVRANELERLLTRALDTNDKLMEKYHALRVAGADSVPPITAPVIPEPFGPLTKAALLDASVGQSGTVIRGMRAKAAALYVEQRGEQNVDELVAIAVRNGEVAR